MDRIGSIPVLIFRHLAGNLPPDDSSILTSWLEESEDNQRLLKSIYDDLVAPNLAPFEEFNSLAEWEAHEDKWFPPPPDHGSPFKTIWLKMLAAAVVIAIIVITIWLSMPGRPGQPAYSQLPDLENISLSDSQSILVLENGQLISLDSLPDGELKYSEKGQITKSPHRLQYARITITTEVSTGVKFHIVHVPKGKRYQLTLPDGTLVWLNPASTLRYPVSLDTIVRFVQLEGEAFFDVKKIKRDSTPMPFVVKVPDLTVEVTGTRFLISAHKNDPNTQTTLTKGSVAIIRSSQRIQLSPGQQATLNKGDSLINVKKIDTSFVSDWLDGTIVFNNDNLPQVLEKFSQYTNVEIVFTKPYRATKDDEFIGKSRSDRTPEEIVTLLRRYYENKVNFKVEGNKIIVSPK